MSLYVSQIAFKVFPDQLCLSVIKIGWKEDDSKILSQNGKILATNCLSKFLLSYKFFGKFEIILAPVAYGFIMFYLPFNRNYFKKIF